MLNLVRDNRRDGTAVLRPVKDGDKTRLVEIGFIGSERYAGTRHWNAVSTSYQCKGKAKADKDRTREERERKYMSSQVEDLLRMMIGDLLEKTYTYQPKSKIRKPRNGDRPTRQQEAEIRNDLKALQVLTDDEKKLIHAEETRLQSEWGKLVRSVLFTQDLREGDTSRWGNLTGNKTSSPKPKWIDLLRADLKQQEKRYKADQQREWAEEERMKREREAEANRQAEVDTLEIKPEHELFQ